MFKALFAAAVIAALIAVPAFARSSATTLKGQAGPGFSIELTKAGKKVRPNTTAALLHGSRHPRRHAMGSGHRKYQA